MKILGLQCETWGSPIQILEVYSENLGVSNENQNICQENLESPMKIWGCDHNLGSSMIICGSPSKIWDLQWKSGSLHQKSGVFNYKFGVSNEKIGVPNENLGISKENLWFSNEFIWVSYENLGVSEIWSFQWNFGALQRDGLNALMLGFYTFSAL